MRLSVQHRLHFECVAGRFGRVGQQHGRRSAGRGDIVAHDAAQRHDAGRGRDGIRAQRLESLSIVQDVGELLLEARLLLVGQRELRQLGNVVDLLTREDHALIIHRRGAKAKRMREKVTR